MYRVTAVLLLTALFAGALGPIYDHHYAERSPSHSHLSYGTSPAHRVERYQSPHQDTGTKPLVDPSQPVVVPSYDGGPAAADASLPAPAFQHYQRPEPFLLTFSLFSTLVSYLSPPPSCLDEPPRLSL
ncbi:MAG: hypothetical protein HY685_05200 [Chloroflexi bacterium]|nr:hypothetical protein [Chloroflexota bacterium]